MRSAARSAAGQVTATVAFAALCVAISVASVTWTVEAAVLRTERSARIDDVRATLQRVRDLTQERQQVAGGDAARLANRADVRAAFQGHAPAALAAIARRRSDVAFVLWDDRRLGRLRRSAPSASVQVYSAGRLQGRVEVAAGPDDALLRNARRRHGATRLLYAVGARIAAASPSSGVRSVPQALRRTVNDVLLVAGGGASADRVYGFQPRPALPLRRLWPFLLALLAAAVALRAIPIRDRRRAEPPPSPVRDAIALVGETLAATHNSRALLPVILRAAVEATGATGGTVTSAGGVTLAARGAPAPDDVTALEVDLQVSNADTALMRLFPPPEGFDSAARDAAAWIGTQALIALENARLHGQVQRQAVTDDLTGLANRRRFLTQLEAELNRSARSGSPLGIVIADLDDFKQVNDTYGHEAGDQALRSFAAILQATVRDIDLPVRLGGEEFAVMLPDTDIAGAIQLAERVRQTVESTEIEGPEGRTITLTASFGVSCFPLAARAEELLTDADRRLYDAKRRGKNTVVASAELEQPAVGPEHPSDEPNRTA
jgi:diguanylate cyclase (GGDEF)-like protein